MCKVTFIYLGLKNMHHRCWGLGGIQFLFMKQLYICMLLCWLNTGAWLKSFLLSFLGEAGEHRDYLSLDFTMRPFGNALAALAQACQ